MNWIVMSLFLYFPEDKTEYIPAAIWMIAFLIAALLTMKFIVKVSNKQAQKAKEFEQDLEKKLSDQKERL